ncbi:MAG: DUF3048 C-terminal domain-containing protein [Chloroflexi bacterium]|nr:DUF3048 C-terminal domain-containing protein [Chloroflexota bacterium]
MLKPFRIPALFILLIIGACSPQTASPPPDATEAAITEIPPQTTPLTPTPQPNGDYKSLGPNVEDFPEGYNPLTGQPAIDPSLLDIPALLISISHFPATARPQAGLSFAPYVFEFSITEGATRFLTTFYGEYPEPEIPVKGNCEIRTGAFTQTGLILGNQIWLDANGDGIQSTGERGVGGICVNLYDAAGNPLQQTTTDSNGFYGFNVVAGHYIVQVIKPGWLDFTESNVGDEKADSDADPLSGRMEADVSSSLLFLDAGLVPSSEVTPPPDPLAVMPLAQVGPVRSGRLLYGHVSAFFQDSCLIYAFASAEVLEQIPQCSFVTHEVQGGGYMLGLERMRAIAEDNARKTHSDFNYASNLYMDEPPAGGVPASQVDVYIAYLNQSGWTYDPLYQAWLRYVDTSEEELAGVLHPEVERLTGRQLHFENLIVVFAEHEVVTLTNLNIHLEQGNHEPAMLFRDGRMYEIKWSTKSGEYEKKTGLRRPIQFLNLDGSPAALKPGHTWVLIVTPFSPVTEKSPGVWEVRFYPPEGSK